MQVSEIGTKLTESTIVLHLQNIDVSPLTPAWLQDKLGLRTDEQWTSLNAPGDDEFFAAMYDAKRADWNATVLRQLSDGSFEELPMAPAAELTPEQGTLLGLAAMIWSLAEAPAPSTVGVAALVSEPLEILFDIDSPFLLREAELRGALQRLPPRVLNVELAPVAGLWTNDQRVGTKMAWGDEEPPTYHAASMVGLIASEIAVLFGVYESEVVSAGLPTALRGPRRPSVT